MKTNAAGTHIILSQVTLILLGILLLVLPMHALIAETLLFQFGGAGTGNGQFDSIGEIAVGNDGRIYVVDTGNARIQIFDANGTFLKAFGSRGDGPGEFDPPCGIAIDPELDRVYVSDGNAGSTSIANHRVQVFDLDGVFKTSIGTFGAAQDELWAPCQMAIDSEHNLYVVDTIQGVKVFSPAGTFLRYFCYGGAGVHCEGPRLGGIAIDAMDRVYVADNFGYYIRVFRPDGTLLRILGRGLGDAPGEFYRPCSLAEFGLLYVADHGYDDVHDRIQVLDLEGIPHDSFISAVGDQASNLYCPLGIATDERGRIYVAAGNEVKVFTVDRDGDGLLDVWETSGIDFDGNGSVDVPLHEAPFNANPDHKDLFIELDWMATVPPTQRAVQRTKRAFALAPVDAGGIENPDGEPGITLHVDTGDLTVGSEDGAGAGSCTDGIDNGNGNENFDVEEILEIDSGDPDCIGIEGNFLSDSCFDGIDNRSDGRSDGFDTECSQRIEDGIGPNTCADGMDNGGDGVADRDDPDCQGIEDRTGPTGCTNGEDDDGDGLIDAMDPNCLVGDNLGGGNPVPVTNLSGLTTTFYQIKNKPGAGEDGFAAGTCNDGLDNGEDGFADSADPDCENHFQAKRRLAFRYALSAAYPANRIGKSTGGNTESTLNDTAQNWITDEWVRRQVTITDGKGADQTLKVVSNTATRLTVSGPGWSPVPDDTSMYKIINVGGKGEVGGNDIVIFDAFDDSHLMHELGHNMNLRHGGDEDNNYKPNYLSIMNYNHWNGIYQVDGGRILDFSPPRYFGGRGIAPLPPLVETSLDEAAILDPTDPASRFGWLNSENTKQYSNVNGDFDNDGPGDGDRDGVGDGIDWNGDDSVPSAVNVTLDIDGMPTIRNGFPTESDRVGWRCDDEIDNDGDGQTDGMDTDCQLRGFDDWSNIVLGFRQFVDHVDSAHNATEEPEPSLQEKIATTIATRPADLAISKSAEPDPVEVGDDLSYRLMISNAGPNPASQVVVEDVLPEGLSVLDIPSTCQQSAPGQLFCNLGEMVPGDQRELLIGMDTSGACSAGLPGTLTNTARVYNAEQFAGIDPQSSNDSVILDTTRVDTTPPEISCNTPISITPSDAPISFTVTASDKCDPSPTAEVIAFDCHIYTKKGKRIDKTDSCVISLNGDTVTVLDTGGVADQITWTIQAKDISENPSMKTCQINVVVP